MKLANAPHKVSIPGFFQFINRPAHFFDNCTERYGEDYTVKFPDQKVFTFVSHPQSIECLFDAPPETFNFNEGLKILGPLIRDYSLLRLGGETHSRHRKLLQPPFHGKRMQVYGEFICQQTEKVTNSWKLGKSVNLLPSMHEITFNVLLNVVFGFTKGDVCEELRQKARELIEYANSSHYTFHVFVPFLQKDLGNWSVWGHFLRLKKEFEQTFYAEVARLRQNPQPESAGIFSMLVAARYEDGGFMSEQELCDEILTLLLAGYDLVSTNLLWAIYWIHRLPKVRARLLSEFNTISDPLDTKAISQLPYLTAVCKETLRLYPLLGFVRVLNTPLKIRDNEYPAGSFITGNIYSAHRRPEVYPEPEQFKPERFLEKQYSYYQYLPFGGANRVCIGMAFAQFQMKLILFTVLSQYQLELTNAEPLHLHTVRRLSGMKPSKDVRLQVTALQKRKTSVLVG